MKRTRDFKKKLIASLIVFMIMFNNVSILTSGLISLAVDSSDDILTYSAEFVNINNADEVNSEVHENEGAYEQSSQENVTENSENVEENSEVSTETVTSDEILEESTDEVEPTEESDNEESVQSEDITETQQDNELDNEVDIQSEIEETAETEEITNQEETEEEVVETETQKLPSGLALKITLGLKNKGYLKNAKVDIKDLSNQHFQIRENVVLSEYVQSIEENKIRFRQINGQTEATVYIPIELKEEEQVDIAKLQSGVELVLTCTNVTEDGEEEILTRSVRPVLDISDDMDLIVESETEKFIPYIIEGRREALVQLRVAMGTTTNNNLPIKDTELVIPIPQIEGTTIKDVNVQSLSTGFTNGKLNGDVIFTGENWSFQEGNVQINVNNPENNGKYQKNNGDDIYIISYIYENIPEELNNVETTINAKANIFTSVGEKQITTSLEKEYDLSHANSNIVTYSVLRKTQQVSKGYLYANANAEETEYIVEYDNSIDINISRPDLVKAVQINEQEEYFVIDENNKYPTQNEAGENTYYERIRLNKQNLDSIIGEGGNLEVLLENGTSLITIDKNTEDDGDGYLTISFGENKIGRIIIKINNPEGEGILSLVATKAIAKVNYEKVDFSLFKSIEEEFIGLAEIEEGIVTELGSEKIETELKETSTNAQVSLSRSDISTLVENEDVGITITLNNGSEISDMYKNPVFEIVFPSEIEDVTLKDMNLLYGNDELDISNIEILKNELDQVVLRVTLSGMQTKYTMEAESGTTIVLKVDIKAKIYSASKQEEIQMNYYNEDATNYDEQSEEWKMMQEGSSYRLIPNQGKNSTRINIKAPDGFANIQVISNYKEGAELTSINKSLMEDTIETFADAKQADMRMVLINNTDEELKDVSILGRTMFSGNKSIINEEDLGTNIVAPMTSNILGENNTFTQSIYYSENGEATQDLDLPENGWTQEIEDYRNVKSFLIFVNEPIKIGDVLGYSYNFEIPEQLGNNIDIVGTYATTYTGTKTKGTIEADKIKLSTGDVPELEVETISDTDTNSAVEGQIITYTVKVTNVGRSVSTNTVVNVTIPEGTTYIENGKLQPDVEEIQLEVGDIRPGTTEEVEYQVQVDSRTVEEDEQNVETIIEGDNNVEADGLKEPIYMDIPITDIEDAEINISATGKVSSSIIGANEDLAYQIHIYNPKEEEYKDCEVKVVIPEGLDFDNAYIAPDIKEGENPTIINANYDENSREVTWKIDSLKNAEILMLNLKTTEIEESEKDIVIYATVSSPNLNRKYTSNEVKYTLAKSIIDYNFSTNTNNQFIKEGDSIQYVLNVNNIGLLYNGTLELSSSIPDYYKVIGVSVIKEDSSNSVIPSQDLSLDLSLAGGESAQVILDCVVNDLPDNNDNVLTQNSWTITGNGIETIKTENVKNIIQQNYNIENNIDEEEIQNYIITEEAERENRSENEEQIMPLEVNKTSNEPSIQESYKITGRAFNDINNNGEFDDQEEGMANIVAKLCDTKTQKIVAQTSTNTIGEYLFDNIIPGEYYVKFEYDNTKYILSQYKKQGVKSNKNSDAIISNYKAVTDRIVVSDTSISDINIGLVRSGIFDLDLDVNVNQITVQNNEETINYNMENSKLAKVDINPKTVTDTNVYIRYTLTVSNKGEIEGYAKQIVNYVPDGLEFDSTLNPTWYQGIDGKLYTDELQDTILQPGESKTITLILIKQMNEENTGLINNIFEINKSFNNYAIEDIDSFAGNGAENEDDMANADVIIGIQTGGNVINVMLISVTLITLLVALYVVKVYNDRKNKEVIL